MFLSTRMPPEEWERTMRQHRSYMTQRARELRRDMTREEKNLWYGYLRVTSEHWYRQRVIGDYIVDFYCPMAKLAVELDGSQHQELDGSFADEVRDQVLGEMGIRVLRFPNRDVNFQFRRTCAAIREAVEERLPFSSKRACGDAV